MTITATISNGTTLKVYIGGLLHLSIPKGRYIAMQSWIERPDWCVIEIYLEGLTLMCEYTSIEKWRETLKILDQYLP